jgi:hypothetical protein
MSVTLSGIARQEYDRNEGSRSRADSTDISNVKAETGNHADDHRNGGVKLETLDVERMRLSRVSARERLESALGPDLTQLLLSALMQEGEGAPDSDSLSQDHAA